MEKLVVSDFMECDGLVCPEISRLGGVSAGRNVLVANNPTGQTFGTRKLKSDCLLRNSKVKKISPEPAPNMDLFSTEALDIALDGNLSRLENISCCIGRGILIKLMAVFKSNKDLHKFRFGFTFRITKSVIGGQEMFVVEDDGAGWNMEPAYGHAVAEAATTHVPGTPQNAYHYEYCVFSGLPRIGSLLLRYEVDCVDSWNGPDIPQSDHSHVQVEIKSHQTKFQEDVEYNAYCVLAGRTYGLVVVSHKYGIIKNVVKRTRESIEHKHGEQFLRDLICADGLLSEVFKRMNYTVCSAARLQYTPRQADCIQLIFPKQSSK